jgi:hypothetical protein
MVFLYLIAALSALLTFSLKLLPGSDFLPIPSVAYTAMGTAAGWTGWLLGLGGADIKETLTYIIFLVIPLELTYLGWKILMRWKPPLIQKFMR